MLEHARDEQGEDIKHPADQEFLLNQKSAQTTQKPQRIEQAYFHFVRQTGGWQKVRGSEVAQVPSLIAHALTKLARTPMNENEFHEITNFEYAYLNQNNQSNQPNQSHTTSEYDRKKPDYLKAYAGDPYFYQQNNEWYYVDDEGIAHLIHDDRINALNETKQNKVFEDDFHYRTQNSYQHYKGLAYLPEIIEEDDVFEITTMDELKATIHQFARDLVSFLSEQNIDDNRSIKAISKLFIRNNLLRIQDIPNHWLGQLVDKHNDEIGQYRVRMFISEAAKEMVEKIGAIK